MRAYMHTLCACSHPFCRGGMAQGLLRRRVVLLLAVRQLGLLLLAVWSFRIQLLLVVRPSTGPRGPSLAGGRPGAVPRPLLFLENSRWKKIHGGPRTAQNLTDFRPPKLYRLDKK